tara:strand:- start:22360 stop:23076 length:717 start_codon:yes stop_codon:yes gene_type:complete
MKLFVSPQVIDTMSMKNLDIGFGDRVVINNMCCDLPTGKVVHVKGRRGVGKSAFLRVLAGIEVPTQGEYYINSKNTLAMSFEEFLEYRILIGYSFDYGGLIHNMTIKDNLILPLRYHNAVEGWLIEERVEYYLRLFDLWDVRDERPSFVSGSMRKEACVARAFIMEPEMVILDCPTVGMHKHNIQVLIDLVKEKQISGNLKHVFVASDDDEFISSFATASIDLDDHLDQSIVIEQEAA